MIVGTVKEIKTGENRVGVTPEGVRQLVSNGHKVLVERGAGVNSGFSDEEYQKNGAILVNSAKEVWHQSDMIVKVKEPLESEYQYFREGLIIFTYLHLASEGKLTKELLKCKVIGVAYETVELDDGSLPLLIPMSEVAGKMAIQVGAHYLERTQGGYGNLLSGVTGVPPAKVAIIGTGVVGASAAKVAYGIGADATLIGRNPQQLDNIKKTYSGIKTLLSNPENIEKSVIEADLVVGAVAITGSKVPKLVTRDMVRKMKRGAVIVDVAIDQGGCVETSRATSHANPVYVEEGVIHYCVPNMPGAVPHTSTLALTNATLPYVLKIANNGFENTIKEDEALAKGVNTYKGKLTNKAVADAFELK